MSIAQNRRDAERRMTMLTQTGIEAGGTKAFPRMSPEKITAFFTSKEFPWLQRCVKIKHAKRIHVQRVEMKLLDYMPRCYDNDEYEYRETIIFLDEKGSKISQPKNFQFIIEKIVEAAHHINPHYVSESQTIGEKLRLLGKNLSKVHYIYSFFNGMSSVIIYKFPNDISASQMLADYNKNQEQMIAIERKAIRDVEK